MLMTAASSIKTAIAERHAPMIDLARSILRREEFIMASDDDQTGWRDAAKNLAKTLLYLVDSDPEAEAKAANDTGSVPKTYTEEERRKAFIVLGYSTPDGKVIPLEERSVENLVLMIQNLREKADDRAAEHTAAIKALDDRLRAARSAKRFANRRADVAEEAMRKMLNEFKSLELK